MTNYIDKNIMKNNCILFILLLSPTSAMAYLDPGSGSILIYFIIGVFATLVYSIKNLIFNLKAIFYSFFFNENFKNSSKKNIVFYSEGSQYWTTFKPIINHLSYLGIECSYLTSDKSDPGLNYKGQNYEGLHIGNNRFAIMSLNILNAKILVTTTPQLEVMHLKRSKYVDYFIHIIHAPIDVFKYSPFAFDFFDCVMCSGQHQIDHLRIIEKVRNMPHKKLLKTGLIYFDELIKGKELRLKNSKTTILVAPTWGVNGLLRKVGFKALKLLLLEGYKVILRPHPQSFISENKLVEEIENECNAYSEFIIDKTSNAQSSMQHSDILISDASGIIFDFAFIYEKPVIAFNDTLDEGKLLELFEINKVQKTKIEIWEVKNKHKVAIEIKTENINQLPKLVSKTLNNQSPINLLKFRDESIFNYGFAGETAAKQLQNLLNKV